jgi:hypothetical protein
MKAYFDDFDQSNLGYLSMLDGDPWLTFNNPDIIELLKKSKFEIADTSKIKNKGIYLVSVRNYADYWSGFEKTGPNRHVLHEIPLKIIQAAKEKKVIIVIDNSSEGFPLLYGGIDGFREMHRTMNNLKLPKFSVILVDNNKFFYNDYNNWCIENRRQPMFKHVDFLTGFYYFDNKIPEFPLLIDALRNPNVKFFNSLNRTCRPHRVDHLYYLIKHGWHKQGIVSGHFTNCKEQTTIPESYVLNIEQITYENVLKENCPLIADADYSEHNPDDNQDHIFNHDLYKNSLITVTTETAFHQPGMFITEKTFKPIVAGHPFMILGQYRILETLREMGYQVDFPGIDQSYDTIINPQKRFLAFHDSLRKWISLEKKLKLEYMIKAIPMVKHNKYIYNSHDYIQESFGKLYNKTKDIFKHQL